MSGRFGRFGGQYVPETVMNALIELEREFEKAKEDKDFMEKYRYYLREYSGRPTPLYYAYCLPHCEIFKIIYIILCFITVKL